MKLRIRISHDGLCNRQLVSVLSNSQSRDSIACSAAPVTSMPVSQKNQTVRGMTDVSLLLLLLLLLHRGARVAASSHATRPRRRPLRRAKPLRIAEHQIWIVGEGVTRHFYSVHVSIRCK